MANTILKLTTILSLLIPLALHGSQLVSSTDIDHDMENVEEDQYVLDTPSPYLGPRSRFLTSIIKKGDDCVRGTNNICNGIRANKGTDLLFCCKKHCRNVLSDENNCGKCKHKCKFGEKCCSGVCTHVLFNHLHCGECKKKCKHGVPCENGMCGYASNKVIG